MSTAVGKVERAHLKMFAISRGEAQAYGVKLHHPANARRDIADQFLEVEVREDTIR
jgi:hypothetical protein